MKIQAVLLSSAFCLGVHAATSDHLFVVGSGSFSGSAGNVLFNGQQFVAPIVQSNGAMSLMFLDTNGVVLSNATLSITGSSPRLSLTAGLSFLLWVETNSVPNVLRVGQIAAGALNNVGTLATNVTDGSASITSAGASLAIVWEAGQAIYVRWLNLAAAPLAPAVAVSSGAAAQQYPSVGTDRTNVLVCWAEQSAGTNDWHTRARVVASTGAVSLTFIVSRTNSAFVHPTACSFGTNFLVTWSGDNGPFPSPSSSNMWWHSLRGRLVSPVSPIGTLNSRPELVLVAAPYWNTNAGVAFGGGRYLVGCPGQVTQRVQPLAPDGSVREYPLRTLENTAPMTAAGVAFGAERFCILYSASNGPGSIRLLGSIPLAPSVLTNLRRDGQGIAVDGGSYILQVSSNCFFSNSIGIDRSSLWLLQNWPRLYARAVDTKLDCVERLRSLDWAKQRWAYDFFKTSLDTPQDFELFGPTRYLTTRPACPEYGFYTLGTVGTKPSCSLANHTL